MKRYTWRTCALEFTMIAAAVIFMVPIYIMVNIAIRGPGNTAADIVPTTNPTIENFVTAWTESRLGGALLTSAILTVVSVTLIVIFAALAAYAVERATSRWSTGAFYLFLVGILVPFQVPMIPMYENFAHLHAVGNPITLVGIYVGLRIPFTIFLYAAFLRQLPIEYEEAAALDGAGPLRSFVLIVFPLMRPVTGTVVVLNGLFVWNDFFTPLLYLSGTKYSTVPLAIYSFVTDNSTNWPVVFAALIISVIPILVTFFFLQKSLIKGFASGVKG